MTRSDANMTTRWVLVSLFMLEPLAIFVHAASIDYPVGGSPISVAVGDFNGDGKLDIVVANYGSNNVSVLLGHGDGTFGAQRSYTVKGVGSNSTSIVVGDLNHDGKLDVVVASGGFISVLLGDG